MKSAAAAMLENAHSINRRSIGQNLSVSKRMQSLVVVPKGRQTRDQSCGVGHTGPAELFGERSVNAIPILARWGFLILVDPVSVHADQFFRITICRIESV